MEKFPLTDYRRPSSNPREHCLRDWARIVVDIESVVFRSAAWNIPPPDTGATPVLSEPAAPSSVKKRKFGPRSLPLGQSAVPSQRNNSQDNVPGPS
jgi:hypothetical protein